MSSKIVSYSRLLSLLLFFVVLVFPYLLYYLMLALAAYILQHGQTYLQDTSKPHIFYNISYLQSNCFYQILSSFNISFTYFSANRYKTKLVRELKDLIKAMIYKIGGSISLLIGMVGWSDAWYILIMVLGYNPYPHALV